LCWFEVCRQHEKLIKTAQEDIPLGPLGIGGAQEVCVSARVENLEDSSTMLAQAGSEAAAPAALESYSRESSKPSQFATKLGDKKKAAAKANVKKGGGAGKAGGAKTAPDQGTRSRDDDTVPPPAR
jgi:hypothetical protein